MRLRRKTELRHGLIPFLLIPGLPTLTYMLTKYVHQLCEEVMVILRRDYIE